jgi:hypothetical protein
VDVGTESRSAQGIAQECKQIDPGKVTMISLSAAILLGVILYLVDRNGKWPIAWLYAKRIMTAFGIALLLFALYLAYDTHERNRIAKATAAREESESVARAEAYRAQQAQEQRDAAKEAQRKAEEEQRTAEYHRMEESSLAAGREKARLEHARRIPRVRLSEIWVHNNYTNTDWLSDIQIQNDTPETIKSITLAITRTTGEQPRYAKFSIFIEPGRFSLFSRGKGAANNNANTGCATDQYGQFHCGHVLDVPDSKGAVKIAVADFEGTR